MPKRNGKMHDRTEKMPKRNGKMHDGTFEKRN